MEPDEEGLLTVDYADMVPNQRSRKIAKTMNLGN